MPKEMTVSINTSSEVEEMFDYLCKRILLRHPGEVKRACYIPILASHKLTFNDLITAIEKSKVRFDLTLTYTTSDITKNEPIMVGHEDGPSPNKEYYKDDVTRNMEAQAKEITNNELSNVVKVEGIVEVKEMDDSDFFRNTDIPIPDFLD